MLRITGRTGAGPYLEVVVAQPQGRAHCHCIRRGSIPTGVCVKRCARSVVISHGPQSELQAVRQLDFRAQREINVRSLFCIQVLFFCPFACREEVTGEPGALPVGAAELRSCMLYRTERPSERSLGGVSAGTSVLTVRPDPPLAPSMLCLLCSRRSPP